jgi:transcriptional regulator with GAF, ATPase, and Fis domain
MQMGNWLKQRETPGTIADVARRVLESDAKYRAVEKTLQSMYVLEALMKHGGNQTAAAKAIGVTNKTVNCIARSLGLTSKDLRATAERLRSANAERLAKP